MLLRPWQTASTFAPTSFRFCWMAISDSKRHSVYRCFETYKSKQSTSDKLHVEMSSLQERKRFRTIMQVMCMLVHINTKHGIFSCAFNLLNEIKINPPLPHAFLIILFSSFFEWVASQQWFQRPNLYSWLLSHVGFVLCKKQLIIENWLSYSRKVAKGAFLNIF